MYVLIVVQEIEEIWGFEDELVDALDYTKYLPIYGDLWSYMGTKRYMYRYFTDTRHIYPHTYA